MNTLEYDTGAVSVAEKTFMFLGKKMLFLMSKIVNLIGWMLGTLCLRCWNSSCNPYNTQDATLVALAPVSYCELGLTHGDSMVV